MPTKKPKSQRCALNYNGLHYQVSCSTAGTHHVSSDSPCWSHCLTASTAEGAYLDAVHVHSHQITKKWALYLQFSETNNRITAWLLQAINH